MDENEEIELTAEETVALRALREGPLPPAELERATVRRLEDRGLIGSASSRRVWTLAAAAAIIVAFGLGTWFGAGLGESLPGEKGADAYVLLLYHGPEVSPVTGEEAYRRVAEYTNWAKDLREKGVPVMGTKLTSSSWNAAGRETDLGSDELVGFFMLEANSIERALELAGECPHLNYGGKVVVRKVDEV